MCAFICLLTDDARIFVGNKAAGGSAAAGPTKRVTIRVVRKGVKAGPPRIPAKESAHAMPAAATGFAATSFAATGFAATGFATTNTSGAAASAHLPGLFPNSVGEDQSRGDQLRRDELREGGDITTAGLAGDAAVPRSSVALASAARESGGESGVTSFGAGGGFVGGGAKRVSRPAGGKGATLPSLSHALHPSRPSKRQVCVYA